MPPTPPDNLPIEYETLTNTISGGNHWDGELLRGIVVLQFKRHTTLDDKQAAIDAVSGTVVGGRPLSSGEGIYLVRVRDDGTVEPLFAAISRLKQFPQVLLAMPEQVFNGFTTFLTPSDGLAAQSGRWRLNPDSAFGNTSRGRWALEAVNAPFAWGCSTGGSTRVGVLDMDLHREGEIVPNVDTTFRTRPAHTNNHGTYMASIIAARANDGSGITGMMWNARVSMADVSAFEANGQPILIAPGRRRSDTSIILIQFEELVLHGARVINLSVGNDSAQTGPRTPAQDAARAEYGGAFNTAINHFLPFGALRPLWVVSAGNMLNATDVYWDDVTGIADVLPTESLIVTAASAQKGRLLPEATGTGAIDIAAPGEDVAVSDGAGTSTVSGASPATALVSGAAGLLFAFDSTLTADSVRAWLIRAAKNSGRKAGRYPLLDAYGALRIAAELPRGPICGNRVWRSGDTVLVQRGSKREVLATGLGATTGDLALYHGGRRIDVDYTRSLLWNPATGWQLTTAGAPSTTPSGFYWSANARDHDGLGGSWSLESNGSSYSYWYGSDGNLRLAVPMTLPVLSSNLSSECRWKTWRLHPSSPDSVGPYPRYECSMVTLAGTRSDYKEAARSGGAMSPDGRFTALPLTVVEDVFTLLDWSACPAGTFWATTGNPTPEHPNQCRDLLSATQPLSTFIVIADSATRSAHTATDLGLTGRNLDWVAITEDGREIVMQSSVCTKSASASFPTCSDGRIEWRALSLANWTIGTSSNFSAPLPAVARPERWVRGAGLRAMEAADTTALMNLDPSLRAKRERREALAGTRRP
ncbi:MAG: S8 family peptidase [Gemmatimonadaceae bacterium]